MEFTVYVCELRSFSVSGIRFSMFYLHFHYCSFGRNVMTFVALFTGVDHGRAGDKSPAFGVGGTLMQIAPPPSDFVMFQNFRHQIAQSISI